jgi:dTMP kinase
VNAKTSEKGQGWIGVDFDGTLAKSLDYHREGDVGAPIWRMIYRVQKWLDQGKTVKIVTARAGNATDEAAIHYFLHRVGLPPLEIINHKDHEMLALWDDKAIRVDPENGQPMSTVPFETYAADLRLYASEEPTLFEGDAFCSVVIVFGDSKVALVGRDDEKKYMLPAGRVEKGETSVQCASRELREETGLDIAPDRLVFIGASLRKSKEQNNSFFATQIFGNPKLKGGDDVDMAFWQDVWDLPKLKFDPTNALIKSRKVLSTSPDSRGLLIAFEGIDGSGKSTQVRLLGEFLAQRGIAFTVSKWNSSALIADVIAEMKSARRLSPSLFFLLHAADMMARYENQILPALQRNEIVLCDRYFYTGIVRDAIRGIDPQQNAGLYTKLRQPDVIFYCKAGSQIAVDRISKDRLGFYNTGMDVGGFGQDKKESAVGYEKEMDRLYQEFLPDNTVTLDATQKITSVGEEVLKHIQDLILDRYEIADEESVAELAGNQER